MRIDLLSKAAIVSASIAGIGLATAKALAAAGAAVVINGRTQEAVNCAVKAIAVIARGAKVTGFPADLGNAGGCDRLAADHRSCDVLVIKLGVYGTRTSSRSLTANGLTFSKSTLRPACLSPAPICRA